MEEKVGVEEYEAHKNKCGKSFGEVFDQLKALSDGQAILNRAVLGEPELKQKGLIDMTSEMYQSVMMAKGGEKLFVSLVKLAGAVLTITGAFWAVYEFFKRVNIK